MEAVVQLVKEEYIIVALPQHHHRWAFAPAKMVSAEYEKYQLCNAFELYTVK